ncbi:unnamed protein product [Rotaria sordida]|uniref:Uncharacterized protein n=1 Tax=Rotaria sordida TaxID=392033 RepID=A0A819RN58_9BILA|nr:unnamed protein product [Rotaria sordida]
MAGPDVMELASLGRSFQLGMLYDVRSDMLISGVKLWDKEDLECNIMEYPKPDTHVKIITEDSLQAKAHSLGVEGSVKLSLIGGLINIDGSAKFADDSNKSNHVTRLTLKYHTTTKFKELTMNHLGAGRIRHPELFDSNIATHVVTGVLYGAEAFFIFDRVISEEENKKEVAGTLHAVINKIPMCKIEAKVKLNLNENERNFVDKLNCTFYGDFKLDTNPRNFEDAIRIYADLPKYLGDKQQNAVPKKVSLYPLHRLDSKAMKIVRDISSSVVDYCVNFLQDLQVLEIRVLDLTTSKMFTYFSYMQQQLSDFAARLSELDRDLKKQMISILPTVRGGGSEESALLTLFKKVDISPFNKRKLTSWVEDKEKEVSLMEQFISALTKNSKANITVKSSSLNDTIGDLSYEYILCLSFRFTDEQDPQLEDMWNYLQGTDGLNSGKTNLAWFKNSSVLNKTRTSLRQFIEFAASNANKSSNIKFVVNEEYPTDSVKQALLVLYENGVPNESFVIPSKPNAPRKTNATDDSITLAWDDAQIGSEEIKYYEIMYLYVSAEKQVVTDENSPEAWTAVATDDAKKEKHISNLPAGVPFLFKVRSVTEIGVSVFSENSQIILTLGTVELTSETIELLMHEIDGLEEQEIKEYYATFCELCPDGKMTKDIFNKAFQAVYPDGNTDKYSQYAFNIMNNNKDRTSNFVEYVIAMRMHNSDDLEKSLSLAFDIFDYNKNGNIDEKELIRMITTTGELINKPCDQKMAKRYAQEIFDVCDPDFTIMS